jgi:hypothetical protein
MIGNFSRILHRMKAKPNHAQRLLIKSALATRFSGFSAFVDADFNRRRRMVATQ